jgi:hypothetical protein
MRIRLSIIILFFSICLAAQKEKRKVFTTTPTYSEVIASYKTIIKGKAIARMETCGLTDAGIPLTNIVLSRDTTDDPGNVKSRGKLVIMINNGIHPGEPDGIDACIELTRNFCSHPEQLPANIVLCIIPVYNIDGCLNRSSTSRANQNGPVEYGFRGNAKNLDLNRDFIKCDAQNTFSLEEIIRNWKPDVFIDTHVSDGADYQYVMTLIATQRSKLNPVVSKYMDEKMVPALYADMKTRKYEMCPYVESLGETPETGIVGFLETPRFSTGYTSLFNCISFVTETHMWKPYNDRVWATYEFLSGVISYCTKNANEIISMHKEADADVSKQKQFTLNWQLDTTQYTWIGFKGFEAKHKLSTISGLERLYYDRNAPYEKQVKFYNTYSPVTTITAPSFYIIPQAYSDIIHLYEMNGVKMKRLTKDTLLYVEAYHIDDYKTGKTPYESHYLHSGVKVTASQQMIIFHKGDYVVEMNQPVNRYIVETLEPEGGDSFFAWNYFDGILQQKEWFSDYIFEEKADSLLQADPKLKADLVARQKSDTAFAKDNWAQLSFIYQHSPYMEKTYNRYPVARIMQPVKLPCE